MTSPMNLAEAIAEHENAAGRPITDAEAHAVAKCISTQVDIHSEDVDVHFYTAIDAARAAYAEGRKSGLEEAVQAIDYAGDSAVTEALGMRLCCSGLDCGCRGATVGEFIAHNIRALKGGDL